MKEGIREQQDLLKLHIEGCISAKAEHFHQQLKDLHQFVKNSGDFKDFDFDRVYPFGTLFQGMLKIIKKAEDHPPQHYSDVLDTANAIFDFILDAQWNQIKWTEQIFNEFNAIILNSQNKIGLKYYLRIGQLPGINWNSTRSGPATPLLHFLAAFNDHKFRFLHGFSTIINQKNLDWFAASDGWTPFWQLCYLLTQHHYLRAAAQPKILQIINAAKTPEERKKLNHCLTAFPKTRVGVTPLWFMADNLKFYIEEMQVFCKAVLNYAIEQGNDINWNVANSEDHHSTPFQKLLERQDDGSYNYGKPSKLFKDLVTSTNAWDLSYKQSKYGDWVESHFSTLLHRFLIGSPEWLPIIEDFILNNPQYDFEKIEKVSIVLDKHALVEHPGVNSDLKKRYQAMLANAKKALDPATRNEYLNHLIALNARQQEDLYKDGADIDVLPTEVQDIVFSYLRRSNNNPINLVQFRTVFVQNCHAPQQETPEQALAKLRIGL